MRRTLTIAVGMVIATLLAFVVIVNGRPDTTHVERSIHVDASPADVFVFGNDLERALEWSPWMGLDPDQEVAFSDRTTGVGAWYTWEGDDKVGKGRQEIVESVADERVVTELQFIEPFESEATATLSLVPEGEGTRVTWAFDSQNGFGAKAMSMFVDMDEMLGPDFQRGLEALKPLAEQAAEDRIDAEMEAAREAEMQAASEEGAVEAAE